MRLAAYVIAGSPAWAAQSVASYYDLVDTIVVSYDIDEVSWAGEPLEVDATIARMLQVDRFGKLTLLPGAYRDPNRCAADQETQQRQEALDLAGKNADWVLQLDSDEVALSSGRLGQSILDAHGSGALALEYPSRHAYQRTFSGRLLERSTRRGGPRASFLGPVAVRAGADLHHRRCVDGEPYRLDFAARSTDPALPGGAPVDGRIHPDEAVMHMFGIRTREQMESHPRTCHPEEPEGQEALRRWTAAAGHPRRALVSGRFSGRPERWLRIVDDPVGEGDGDFLRR